jgi:hypothetical protein
MDNKKIFNLLTINGRYQIIGSGNIKGIKYKSDIDLQEFISAPDNEKSLTDIYKIFKRKFKIAKKNPDIFITDFKCGMNSNSEPLRWSYNDMIKGYKKMDDGRPIRFEEALLHRTMIKMDIIAIIDGNFIEFSENYYFNFNKHLQKSKHLYNGNYFEHDVDKKHILNSVLHSYDEYMNVQHNYLKGLKRAFSVYRAIDKKQEMKRLIDFFNSDTGFLNKVRSDLDIVLLIMSEQHFRHVKVEDVRKSLLDIKQQLNKKTHLSEYGPTIHRLDEMINKNKLSVESIRRLRNDIYDNVNKSTLEFIEKNKDLLLY